MKEECAGKATRTAVNGQEKKRASLGRCLYCLKNWVNRMTWGGSFLQGDGTREGAYELKASHGWKKWMLVPVPANKTSQAKNI